MMNRGQTRQSSRRFPMVPLLILFCLLVLIAFVYSANRVLLSPLNLQNIASNAAYTGVMAVGLAVSMLAGNADCSQMSVGAFCCILSAALVENRGWPLGIAIALGLLVGVFIGVVNGVLITQLKIPSVINTFAVSYIVRALAYIPSDGNIVFFTHTAYVHFSNMNVLGIPTSLLLLLICAAFIHYVMEFAPFGRKVIAVGSNKAAARFSGIHPELIQIAAMAVSAGMAALGGVVWAFEIGAIQPSQGSGQEFDIMIVAMLGGICINGGKGRLILVLLGALFMAVVKNAQVIMGIDTLYQNLIRGAVMLFAVVVSSLEN